MIIDENIGKLIERCHQDYGMASTDLTELILMAATEQFVTDIHFEPLADGATKLRFRIDGVLQDCSPLLPSNVWTKVLQRLKILAKMDTTQIRRPADGHIVRRLPNGNNKDLRVASIPTRNGEKIVIRLFSGAERLFTIEELDFFGDNKQNFRQLITRPHGLTIVTGPMNSGKTTTLYAALNEINRPEISIAAVEDPTEITLPGITQCEVSEKMSFADGLRGLLRMDCDSLLIGEIRDEETAQIAIRAALTGHRIFTSLHAGDCLGAMLRLADLGATWSNIAAVLSGVVAQRLVRRLCVKCRTKNSDGNFIPIGCDACNNTGYAGRVPLHEIFILTPDTRQKISGCNGDSDKLKAVLSQNFVPIAADGAAKVKAGLTTVSELHRALGVDL